MSECSLPVLSKLIVGKGVYERFSVTEDDGFVIFFGDLGFYASVGIKIVLATSSDWPLTAVIAEDEVGRRYSLQE